MNRFRRLLLLVTTCGLGIPLYGQTTFQLDTAGGSLNTTSNVDIVYSPTNGNPIPLNISKAGLAFGASAHYSFRVGEPSIFGNYGFVIGYDDTPSDPAGVFAGVAGNSIEFLTSDNTQTPPADAHFERMRITKTGQVLINTKTSPVAPIKLEVNGGIHASGDITANGNIAAKYQDVAEWVPATEGLRPGTVVVLNLEQDNAVVASAHAYDTAVAGVVSANPGVILGEGSPSKAQIATSGRVLVHASASRLPIKIGDILVTSDIAGVAMKSEPIDVAGFKMHRPGTIVGKALQALPSGEGDILVLLSLQ
jgi:hypothetical protein